MTLEELYFQASNADEDLKISSQFYNQDKFYMKWFRVTYVISIVIPNCIALALDIHGDGQDDEYQDHLYEMEELIFLVRKSIFIAIFISFSVYFTLLAQKFHQLELKENKVAIFTFIGLTIGYSVWSLGDTIKRYADNDDQTRAFNVNQPFYFIL